MFVWLCHKSPEQFPDLSRWRREAIKSKVVASFNIEKALSKVAHACIFVIGVLISWILALIVWVLVFSWPTFILWSLIVPWWVADILYDDFADWEITHWLNSWILVYVLPFYSKRWFMQEGGICNYSTELQVKYFFEFDGGDCAIWDMTDVARKAVWCDERLDEEDIGRLLKNYAGRYSFSHLTPEEREKIYQRTQDDRLLELM